MVSLCAGCRPTPHSSTETKGVKHMFFESNWLLQFENFSCMPPEIEKLLETVLGWLEEGIDVHIHCISPLTPFGFLFGMP